MLFVEHLAGLGMFRLARQHQQQWLHPRVHQHLIPRSFGRLLTGFRSFSNATPSSPPLPPPSPPGSAHFMVDYLVGSCGLDRTDAVKASKHLIHLKSPKKPDEVLRLLKETGLCGTHIRRLVRSSPRILVADVKKTLEPKIMALQAVGLSKSEVAQLISVNPNVIRIRNAVPKIKFWRTMLGDNKKLLKLATNTHLLGCTVDANGNPNLSFLRSIGMSDADIARIIVRRPRLISTKLDRLLSAVEKVRILGIEPGSGMFLEALSTVLNLSEATLEAKSNLLKSFGWSGDELLYAFQYFPAILRLSKKKICEAMNFLLKEVGYQPSYVARRSVLLGFSIDKRLIPRYYVLQFLKKKGLPQGDSGLFTVMSLSDRKFVEKYITPISENVPEMIETYPKVTAMKIAMPH